MYNWEARQRGRPTTRIYIHMEAGLMQEALLYVEGKPDKAGGPCGTYTVRYMEASPCRRPYCIQLGSPTMREAHYKDLHTHGSRSMPEALLWVEGKPDEAGDPVIDTL